MTGKGNVMDSRQTAALFTGTMPHSAQNFEDSGPEERACYEVQCPPARGCIGTCDCADFRFPSGVEFKVPFGKLQSAEEWVRARSPMRTKGAHSCAAVGYDFSGVPDSELRACVHYEFSRESRRIAEAVDFLRPQLEAHFRPENTKVGAHIKFKFSFKKFTEKHGFHYDAIFLFELAGCPGFPDTSWPALPAKERQELGKLPDNAIELHNRHFLSEYPVFVSDVPAEFAGLNETTLSDWKARRTPKAMRGWTAEKQRAWLLPGFFMVNFLHPPERIVESFRKWLLKRHPRATEPAPEKRGRKSDRDRLNALGAMRLRFYCRALSEAQDLTASLRRKEYGLYYSDR